MEHVFCGVSCIVSGMFFLCATRAEIAEMSPKLPLGSSNSLVIWRAKPKIHNVGYTKANGALWKKKPTQKWKHEKTQKLYIHESEISAHSHTEEEIEGGPEEERESSSISIFSPPALQNRPYTR